MTLFRAFYTFLSLLFDFALILGKMADRTDFIQGLALLLPLFTAFIAFAGFIGVMGIVFGFVLKIIQKPLEKEIADLKTGQKELKKEFKELKTLILEKLK